MGGGEPDLNLQDRCVELELQAARNRCVPDVVVGGEPEHGEVVVLGVGVSCCAARYACARSNGPEVVRLAEVVP